MSKTLRRGKSYEKSVNLALQGGGSHGAFTWGVLDRIFEDDQVWIDSISGTSAGAMNAVVATHGMCLGGSEGARQALADFWHRVSTLALASPIQRSWWDLWMGNWSMDHSPGYLAMDMMQRVASPYDVNPLAINPLRKMVEDFVDFDRVRSDGKIEIFLSATNVETGRVRVFNRKELTIDVVMASACLPQMFQAVEIDGTPYWDGGYMGNPVLFPFIDHSPCDDILIVQINPIERKGTPHTARDINDRVNEITFNASLMKDLRMIHFVETMMQKGKLSRDEFRTIRVHMIEGGKDLHELGASSKMNAEWAFLQHLRDVGRNAAGKWLAKNYESIGQQSTLDLSEIFAAKV